MNNLLSVADYFNFNSPIGIIVMSVVILLGVVVVFEVIKGIVVANKKAKQQAAKKEAAAAKVEAPAPVEEKPEPAPVQEEPIVEQPVAEEAPVEEAVVEEEIVEEVVEEPAQEEPIVEEPIEEVVEDVPVEDEPIVEEVVEEIVEEPVVEEAPIAGAIFIGDLPATGESDDSAKRVPFKDKILASDDKIQSYYATIDNAFRSYRKINPRVSIKGASYRFGRDLVAKMTIRGKTLKLHLALDVKAFDETVYFQKDMSDVKEYVEIPFAVKVKSDRALNNALKLIDALAEKHGIESKTRYSEVDSIAMLKEMADDEGEE